MSKKNRHNKSTIKSAGRPAEKKSISLFIKIFLVLTVIILYGQTRNYEFVLDDDLFISNNPVVQKGIGGIGEAFSKGSITHFKGSNFQIYRPAQISFFCLQHQLFGLEPGGYHLFNILLYCIIAIIVFNLLRALFPSLHIYYRTLIAFIFIIHPAHTEVVANVKSQDELLASLFCLSSLLFFIKSYDSVSSRNRNLIYSLFSFLIALFSKESSFAFVAIFPVALFLLRGESVKKSLTRTIPFAAAGFFFLGCRHLAIRDTNIAYETSFIENVLYATKTTGETIGTKLGIAFYYLKLMVFPYPLSWDYSFNQIPVMNITDALPLISLGLFLLIGVLILLNIRKQPSVAFGLTFFIILITPTANVFFPNGTTFADRFLFLPSLGFILALTILLLDIFKINQKEINTAGIISLSLTAGILGFIFGSMTISRNKDWQSNYAVFYSGAQNSANSSRTNDGLATTYMNLAQATSDPKARDLYVDSSIIYYQKSLDIYPSNYKSAYGLGYIYALQNKKDLSKKYYRQSIASKPDYILSLNNLGALYANSGNFDSAYHFLSRSIEINPDEDMTLTNICIVSMNLGKTDEAIKFGERAIAIGKGNAKIYNTLSAAYERKGDLEKANRYRSLFELNNRR